MLHTSDYYPFGWEMPGRKYSDGDKYRFGFNGKEDDGDWGTQNIQDYGFRLYNPSIGKFLSVDPLAPEYPWNSTYAFAENRVIQGIDLEGAEFRATHMENTKTKAVTKRITHVQMKILNMSSQLDANATKIRAEAMKKQIEKTYSGVGNDGVEYIMKFNYEIVDQIDFTKDFALVFTDNSTDYNGKNDGDLGKVIADNRIAKIDVSNLNDSEKYEFRYEMTNEGEFERNNSTIIDMYSIEQVAGVGAHELGHLLGLAHVYESVLMKPMYEGSALFFPPNDILWAQYMAEEILNAYSEEESGNISSPSIELIKDNIMNSAGNPINALKTTPGERKGTTTASQLGQTYEKADEVHKSLPEEEQLKINK